MVFVSPFLFNNTYGLPVLTKYTKRPNYYFMLDWSIYTLFVLNSGWKQDSLQIMIFVHICSTWSIVQYKTRFVAWITRNEVKAVSLFNLLYFITIMVYLYSQRTRNFQIKYSSFHRSICRLFVQNHAGNVILSKWWYS
jgi:hypothetical protein